MRLGIFPEQGGSIENLGKSGQDTRFVRGYLERYAVAFDEVLYFSYRDEQPPLPPRCTVVPNRGVHRWAYAFLLPLVQRKRVRGCDVFRVMQAYGAIPAILAKLLYGKPYVVTYGYRYFDNVRAQEGLMRALFFRWRARLGAQLADRVIVTTPEMAEYVGAFTPQAKLLYVPNGVDTAQFCPAGKAAQPAHTPAHDPVRTVVHVGRLAPDKNLALLIDALALLDTPVRLVLAGGGPLRGELEAHARARGVAVEFLGPVAHERLPALLAAADLFVLCSLSEGHPKALLEAMSCGLPCVGSDVPGTRDVIRHEQTGLLCALSAGALAAAVQRILDDPSLAARLGAAARAYIVESYELGVLLAREIEAMQELARRKGRR